MNLTLPPELEEALAREAQRLGTTPQSLALTTLRERFIQADDPDRVGAGQETLADFLRDFIGVLDSGELVPGGARMSEDTGRKFTEILLEKRARGQL